MQKIKEVFLQLFDICKAHKYSATLAIFALLVLLPLQSAKAIIIIDWFLKAIVGGLLYVIGFVMFGLAEVILWLSTSLLKVVADPGFITMPYTKIPFVQEGIVLSQGLASIFMVISLVAIGLGVALRLTEAKGALTTFLIAGILIFITPIITGPLIDFSNIFMDSFLRTGAANGLMAWGGVMSQFTDIMEGFWADYFSTSLIEKFMSIFPALIILLLYAAVSGFTYVKLAILLLVRYVMLWTLMMVAPLAFAMWPFTQLPKRPYLALFNKFGDLHNDWWKEFIGWCIVGVPTSFFLYLAARVSVIMYKMTGDASIFKTGSLLPHNAVGLININFGEMLATMLPMLVPLIILNVGMDLAAKMGAQGAGAVLSMVDSVGKMALQAGTMAVTGGISAGVGAAAGSATGQKVLGGIQAKTAGSKLFRGVGKVAGNLRARGQARNTAIQNKLEKEAAYYAKVDKDNKAITATMSLTDPRRKKYEDALKKRMASIKDPSEMSLLTNETGPTREVLAFVNQMGQNGKINDIIEKPEYENVRKWLTKGSENVALQGNFKDLLKLFPALAIAPDGRENNFNRTMSLFNETNETKDLRNKADEEIKQVNGLSDTQKQALKDKKLTSAPMLLQPEGNLMADLRNDVGLNNDQVAKIIEIRQKLTKDIIDSTQKAIGRSMDSKKMADMDADVLLKPENVNAIAKGGGREEIDSMYNRFGNQFLMKLMSTQLFSVMNTNDDNSDFKYKRNQLFRQLKPKLENISPEISSNPTFQKFIGGGIKYDEDKDIIEECFQKNTDVDQAYTSLFTNGIDDETILKISSNLTPAMISNISSNTLSNNAKKILPSLKSPEQIAAFLTKSNLNTPTALQSIFDDRDFWKAAARRNNRALFLYVKTTPVDAYTTLGDIEIDGPSRPGTTPVRQRIADIGKDKLQGLLNARFAEALR